MPKAYFIGGAPRVGKTTLSVAVIKKHPMLGTSTDALRDVLQNVVPENVAPDLYVLKINKLTNSEIIERTTKDIQKAVQYQNEESSAVWKSVIVFVESVLADGFDVLVEGVAILPEYVARLDIDCSAVFIGNTSEKHTKTALESAAKDPHDWLNEEDEEVAKAFCYFSQNYSRYIESECKKYNQHYVEIYDDAFEGSMQHALTLLLNE